MQWTLSNVAWGIAACYRCYYYSLTFIRGCHMYTHCCGLAVLVRSHREVARCPFATLGGGTLFLATLGGGTLFLATLGGGTLFLATLGGGTVFLATLGGGTLFLATLGGGTLPLRHTGRWHAAPSPHWEVARCPFAKLGGGTLPLRHTGRWRAAPSPH